MNQPLPPPPLFTKGDKVRAVTHGLYICSGAIYTVAACDDGVVALDEVPGYFSEADFEPALGPSSRGTSKQALEAHRQALGEALGLSPEQVAEEAQYAEYGAVWACPYKLADLKYGSDE